MQWIAKRVSVQCPVALHIDRFVRCTTADRQAHHRSLTKFATHLVSLCWRGGRSGPWACGAPWRRPPARRRRGAAASPPTMAGRWTAGPRGALPCRTPPARWSPAVPGSCPRSSTAPAQLHWCSRAPRWPARPPAAGTPSPCNASATNQQSGD